MKDLWEDIPESNKTKIPLSSYKCIQFELNFNDIIQSIEELEEDTDYELIEAFKTLYKETS